MTPLLMKKYFAASKNLKNPKPLHDAVVGSESLEFEFDDVFGPDPAQASANSNAAVLENPNPNGAVYDDPEVIYRRSHSLVGPSSLVNSTSERFTRLARTLCDKMVLNGTSEKRGDKDLSTRTSDENHDTGSEKRKDTVGRHDFEYLKLVGKGGFGNVYQVRKKGTTEIYAMKVMVKAKIIKNQHAKYMKAERNILTKIDHPFIVQLRYSFQTKHKLYLVLDFINGGHLFFQLYNQGLFREDLARVYAAELVSAVTHLHANGIMHRDLKPENILLDEEGHAVLTDFGLAKEFDENTRANSLCGTLDYMAPEVILRKGHDKAADWWSVGVLLFEMLSGKLPFESENREKMQKKILKERVKLPSYLSDEAHSILKGLLQKEASKRLGGGPSGSEEIKKHKWFKPINWRKLEAREIRPSFRPKVGGKSCVANFDEKFTSMPVMDSPVCSPAVGERVFAGYSYVRPASVLEISTPL